MKIKPKSSSLTKTEKTSTHNTKKESRPLSHKVEKKQEKSHKYSRTCK
jgi:hypothetical protein